MHLPGGMLPAASADNFGPAVLVLTGVPGDRGDAAIGAVHGAEWNGHQYLPIAYFQFAAPSAASLTVHARARKARLVYRAGSQVPIRSRG